MGRIQLAKVLNRVIVASLLLALFGWVGVGSTHAEPLPGAVYVLTNAAAGNSVLAFDRAVDGTLTAAGSYSTGGLGSGNSLGSQGALVLSRDNRLLFAVNAGSNEISALQVMPGGLQLASTVASGGIRPTSITSYGNLVYVLNAGGTGNIAGFTVGAQGQLAPVVGSARPLSGNATAPAQVQFSPDGKLLVVTEKATNMIDTYVVGPDGLADGPNVQASAGVTPYGFAFGLRGQFIVSEAAGGAAGAGSVSSYATWPNGQIQAITASAADHQTAPCWVATTNNGRYAYTTNAGSGSVSGYSIAPDGTLGLLNPDGRTGVTGDGSAPTDLTTDTSSQHLYVLTGGAHAIMAFGVQADGSLSSIAGATGLPAGVVGIAAR